MARSAASCLRLESQGVEINMAPTIDQPPRGLERFFERCDRGEIDWAFTTTTGINPACFRASGSSTTRCGNRCVFPRSTSRKSTGRCLAYVPCRQNVDSFRDSGVVVPIKVLHHGVDSSRFPILVRPRRERFSFGTFGDFSVRKGIDVLVRAFEMSLPAMSPYGC